MSNFVESAVRRNMNPSRVFIIILCMMLNGCFEETKIITSGDYGPISIGDHKSILLEKVEKFVSISSIHPVVSEIIYLESPNIDTLQKLNNENGIEIWVNKVPFPLRIEFLENKVVNIWGATNRCIASKEAMNFACNKTFLISNLINIGDSRETVYRVISNNQNDCDIQVGNFVVGYQEFRIRRNNKSKDSDEYKELLMANDAWKFNGLKSLSKYHDPYYSDITLYFNNDKLIKIVHWSSPYEMP